MTQLTGSVFNLAKYLQLEVYYLSLIIFLKPNKQQILEFQRLKPLIDISPQ